MIKSKKGISPILATLLLIVIAVAAVIVTYAWVITFTENTTNNAGALLKQENVRFYTDEGTNYVEIVVRNTGTGDAQVDTVYMGTSSSNLITQTGVDYDPASGIVAAGDTLTVTMEYEPEDDGTTYYFKITTEEGFELPFSKEA
jgi:flagellin-like protein